MTDTLILHHANCPDGVGAAWLAARHLANAEIVPMSYGDDLPDVTGRNVVSVDFCPPTEQLEEIFSKALSCLILDHHQTALGYVDGCPNFTFFNSVDAYNDSNSYPQFVAIIDQTHSGVGLVQQWTGERHPFLRNIEDRDLWKFEIYGTAEVFAAVTSRPYTVEAWDEMALMTWGALFNEGAAIERYRQQLIEACVATAGFMEIPTGDTVWVASAPYAIGSDVAGELAKRTPEGYAAYFVSYPGEKVRFGLRSGPNGADVAAIAEKLGGGGHKHASGFEVPV